MIAPHSKGKDAALCRILLRFLRPMPLMLRRFFSVLALGLVLLGLEAGARAAQAQQHPACVQIRAEMASLSRTRGASGATTRLRRELARVQGALQANDCFRSRGFLGLGDMPPVCAPLKAQAGQLQAQIRAMEGGGDDGRRVQLAAAWQRYGCDAPQRVEQRPQRGVLYATPNDRPGILERLFGNQTEVAVEPYPERGVIPPPSAEAEDEDEREGGERRRYGGRLAVCVRTCDGFFFPVNFEGLTSRDEHPDVCKALCPAAQTQVFYMSQGGEIENAAARDGTPYTSLPNAKKYQESRDLSCICKQPGQTWASAMQGKEDLVEARKGDIIVSPEQAAAMSRPKEAKAAPTSRQREAQKKLERRGAADDAAVLPESALPTGGGASAGIGPRGQQRERFVGANGGITSQITREDGSRITIRNVAPVLGGSELRSGSGEAKQP